MDEPPLPVSRCHRVMRRQRVLPRPKWSAFLANVETVFSGLADRWTALEVFQRTDDLGAECHDEFLYFRTPSLDTPTRDFTLFRMLERWGGPEELDVYSDDSPAGMFVEMVLMLAVRHFPDALTVRSTFGPMEWRPALHTLAAIESPGPWTGQGVDPLPELPAPMPPADETGVPVCGDVPGAAAFPPVPLPGRTRRSPTSRRRSS